MKIQTNFSIKEYNTFGIDVQAAQFVSVTTEAQLISVLESSRDLPKLFLGGGSNLLFTQNPNKLIIHVDLKGKRIIKENDDFVWIEAKAGENWHNFVLWTLNQNFGGLENMSLIPGNVGTTPVQNIGAYGAEIKDTFENCSTFNIENQEIKIFNLNECHFGYRESVFKNEAKDQYVIAAVVFKLTKRNHKINCDYGDIKAELQKNNIQTPTIKDVSNAVIAIRKSKLPDPKELGNCGSFFKNPVINKVDFELIQPNFPEMKYYEVSDTEVKVPAGWLIEQAGFKGKRFGDAGVHEKQALVLVNYGKATGIEILNLAQKIQQSVFQKFGITIETEVNVM